MSTWIDVSVTIRDGMVGRPADPRPEIRRQQSLARSDPANVMRLGFSSHTGTHLDAPLHLIPSGASLEAIVPEATIGRARVLKIHDPRCITVRELEPYDIERGERLLFKTRNSAARWDEEPFRDDHVYLTPKAAKFLVGRGVRTVGIDYISIGSPDRDGALTHRLLLEAGVVIVEGLLLHEVAPGDYDLICLPLKIADADGAPARALLRGPRRSPLLPPRGDRAEGLPAFMR